MVQVQVKDVGRGVPCHCNHSPHRARWKMIKPSKNKILAIGMEMEVAEALLNVFAAA